MHTQSHTTWVHTSKPNEKKIEATYKQKQITIFLIHTFRSFRLKIGSGKIFTQKIQNSILFDFVHKREKIFAEKENNNFEILSVRHVTLCKAEKREKLL